MKTFYYGSCSIGRTIINKEQIEVVNATEIIETAEPPVMAIRKKKDSSIVVALNMVKEGTCDAFVSAGSSGAVVNDSQFWNILL